MHRLSPSKNPDLARDFLQRGFTIEEIAKPNNFDLDTYVSVLNSAFQELPENVVLVLAAEPGQPASDGPPSQNSPLALALAKALPLRWVSGDEMLAWTRDQVMETTNGGQEPHVYSNEFKGWCLRECAEDETDISYPLADVPPALQSIVASARERAQAASAAVPDARKYDRVFRTDCLVVMLRSRCPVVHPELWFGSGSGLRMSWSIHNGIVSWGDWGTDGFVGVEADADGTRYEGRFSPEGDLKEGVMWVRSGLGWRVIAVP